MGKSTKIKWSDYVCKKFGLKRILLLFTPLLLVGLPSVKAQQPGFSNSNYTITQNVLLNPSASADPEVFFDMNLFSMNLFVKNDYVYLPKDQFTILNPLEINTQDDFSTSGEHGMHFELDLQLPAFSRAYKKMGFGGFIRFRGYGNAHKIPSHVAKFLYAGFGYEQQHDEPYEAGDFMIKTMSWGEIGGNFSRIVYQEDYSLITAGISVKYLIGYHNAGLFVSEVDYEVIDDDVDVNLFTGNYGLAIPSPTGNGSGWGVDLGFTYKKTLKPTTYYTPFSRYQRCEKRPYDYRLGLSFLDVGGIRYNQRTLYTEFDEAATIWNDYPNTPINGFREVDNAVVSQFGLNNSITRDTTFFAFLPTSVALEIDKRFGDYFFLNTTGLFGMRFRRNMGVSRLGFFSLTPRWEMPKFEAAMPITMFGYKSPAVGLFLRGGAFFLGTNNLIPYVLNVDVWGIDLYFGFKYNISSSKECRGDAEKPNNWWCPGCKD